MTSLGGTLKVPSVGFAKATDTCLFGNSRHARKPRKTRSESVHPHCMIRVKYWYLGMHRVTVQMYYQMATVLA